jgi:hypothetical protein
MEKPNQLTHLLTSVELGSPAADCAHFGICSVNVISTAEWTNFEPRHLRHLKAVVSTELADNLLFAFPFDGMRADTRSQFFPPEGFRVDSAKMLPNSLVEALGLAPGLCTRPGLYPIQQNELGIVVAITTFVAARNLAIAA